ncbi:MAG: hypothetical protein AAGI13_14870 [Pseudomonadota bacterium]
MISHLPMQMATAWGDLRGSYRALMEGAPGEGRLFFIAVLSSLIYFAGTMLSETAPAGEEGQAWVASHFLSAILWRPLMLYAVGATSCLILRGFDGAGGWVESRAAVFWAMLIAAPVLFLAQIATVAAHGTALVIIQQIAALIAAWVLAVMLAEAHGIARSWAVFAGLVGVILVFLILIRGLFLLVT